MPRIVVLALFLSVAGLGAARAAPAVPLAEPLPADACGALQKEFAAALGFPLVPGTKSPKSVSDGAPAGTACAFSGRATGIKHRFGDALGRLQAIVKGWEEIPDVAAGGANETMEGYRKGDRRIILSLTVEPPAGQCETMVVSNCRLPAKRWQWTFDAVAYRQNQ